LLKIIEIEGQRMKRYWYKRNAKTPSGPDPRVVAGKFIAAKTSFMETEIEDERNEK